MPSVSVVIPHFWEQRRSNIVTLWRALMSGTVEPKEIIIWNNGAPFDVLPHGISVIQSHMNMGCKARFLAAMCATSDYILFQDNDIMVEPQTIQHLLKWSEKLYQQSAVGTVALEGRVMLKGKPYSQCTCIDGSLLKNPAKIDITLGRMELVSRKIVNQVFSDIPFDASTVMDDIWFSHVLQQRGYGRWCVPYVQTASGFVNLPDGGMAAYRQPDHWRSRDALCAQFFPT
jgi:hypothetical protein